jgi:hypothetical protein
MESDMDKKTIDKVSQSVYRQFPEFKGKKPKVDKNYGPQAKSVNNPGNHLLIYSTMAKGIGGKEIPRRVRVVVDDKGNIVRISTSR